ncbi:MAG: hypothetical protein IJ764_03020 [Bacteroidales bacterium]|nr:hypothetical protein [Bacteroidales bacterium]
MNIQKMMTGIVGCALFAMTSCRQNTAAPVVETVPQVVIDTIIEPEPEPEPMPAPAPAPVVKKKPMAQPSAKSETVYVSSYDEKGPVWGHVTMTGDKGTGTIHDSEENTFSVKCIRKGKELWAYDQNSRQYVFKLPESQTEKEQKK